MENKNSSINSIFSNISNVFKKNLGNPDGKNKNINENKNINDHNKLSQVEDCKKIGENIPNNMDYYPNSTPRFYNTSGKSILQEKDNQNDNSKLTENFGNMNFCNVGKNDEKSSQKGYDNPYLVNMPESHLDRELEKLEFKGNFSNMNFYNVGKNDNKLSQEKDDNKTELLKKIPDQKNFKSLNDYYTGILDTLKQNKLVDIFEKQYSNENIKSMLIKANEIMWKKLYLNSDYNSKDKLLSSYIIDHNRLIDMLGKNNTQSKGR